jgi:hypothetical protein
MSPLAGLLLAGILLLIYALALRVVWHNPFRALGILVAGMSIHNLVLMILLRLNTPAIALRMVQSWKDGILLLLLGLVVVRGTASWRRGRRPKLLPIDWIMLAFTAVVLVYFVLPGSVTGGHASLTQRLLGARVLLLLPFLYLFGRVFFSTDRADLVWNLTFIAGSAAVVSVAGLLELWLIPTKTWIDAGANLLSAWFGFHYRGPGGLPENFFQSAGPGYYLRRMVSTYVSPLPIAYTGLLIVPLAVTLLVNARANRFRWLRAAILTLVVTGILFSITRLAIVLLVLEFVLLAAIWRRWWLVVATAMVTLSVAAVLYGYPHVGPLVTADVRSVIHRPSHLGILSQNDPSAAEHSATLAQDLQYVLQHPLGSGVGSSINRFGQAAGTGESAVFDIFGEIGVIGGILYMAAYGLVLVYGLRAWLRFRGDPLLSALAMVSLVGALALAPITATSDVWSEFTVTFLLWWAAGFTVSLANSGQAATTQLAPKLRRQSA